MPSKRKPPKKPDRGLLAGLRRYGYRAVAGFAILAGLYSGFVAAELYSEARELLDRTSVRIYSAPLELREGDWLDPVRLRDHLGALGYTEVGRVRRPGQFSRSGRMWVIHLREHETPAGATPEMVVEMDLHDGRIEGLVVEGRKAFSVSVGSVLLSTFSRHDRALRIPLAREAIPETVVQAFVAAEDSTFFSHHGLSPRSILRALWVNVTEGGYRQGGSTITQQLAKNIFLSREKTLARKLKEALIALYLDARFSKDEILTLYLNEVYLGQAGASAVLGVGAATRHYFGSGIAAASLEQAALLSAVAKGPSYYNPFRHPERARERRNYVLDRMADTGFIEVETADKAKERPLGLSEGSGDAPMAGYFLDHAVARLEKEDREAKRLIHSRLLFSSLDPGLQMAAERAVRKGLLRVRKQRHDEDIQAALVAISPRSGDVVAMVGGEDFLRAPYNRATEALRQAGSTFKPFVYASAFESIPGFNELTPLEDVPVEIPDGKGGVWSPRNFPEGYRGTLPARDALSFSVNVPTVVLGMTVGLDRVVRTAERLGWRKTLQPLPSLPLGAAEVTPYDLALSFLPWTNGGMRVAPRLFTHRVEDRGPAVPLGLERPVRVVDESVSYQVTHMLQDAVARGTGKAAGNYGIASEIAGKTGTTSDLRDAWFIGYTPELLAVVWMGRDSGKPLGWTGGGAALPVWAEFMARAPASRAETRFPVPESVRFVSVCAVTGDEAALWCPSERVPLKRGTVMKTCSKHTSPVDSIRRLWRRLSETEIFLERPRQD